MSKPDLEWSSKAASFFKCAGGPNSPADLLRRAADWMDTVWLLEPPVIRLLQDHMDGEWDLTVICDYRVRS